MNLNLRPYQSAAVEAGYSNSNGVIVAPTGSGKSLIIAGLLNRLEGQAVILQPSKEILESNLERIHASGFKGVGVFSASMGVKKVNKATYATIGSIIKVAEQFTGLDALIIDECHLVNPKGGQYDDFIRITKPKRLLGLTATPYRLHTVGAYDVQHRGLDKVSDIRLITRTKPKLFSKIIYSIQCDELVRAGFLHNPEFIVSGEDTSRILRSNGTGAEFDDFSIHRYEEKTELSLRTIEAAQNAMASGLKHLLVFVTSLKTAAEITADLRAAGISAEMVSGETPKGTREALLRDFKSGLVTAMVNVGVLTTGYDFPRLDCIIGARPTMSLSLYYQMIGRCVRPHAQKDRAVVYDLVNNYGRFGNPLRMKIVQGTTGLDYIIGPQGRMTGRALHMGPEMEEELENGKYRGYQMHELPADYIEWYLRNVTKINDVWHAIDVERLRRRIAASEDLTMPERPKLAPAQPYEPRQASGLAVQSSLF